MKEEIIETDVLCVGGGIAGLMAAIRARECGANVIIAEKANTLRSGSGATGNDHFISYIPDIHGSDSRSVLEELRLGVMHGFAANPEIMSTWLDKTFDIVKMWDSWGIPMKYQGKYEFAGHSFPGRPFLPCLKYSGQMQKSVLTEEALKRGATIMNRVMVFELLADNEIIGAIGIGTREDKVVVFKAKSVILGTGSAQRLYPSPTPGWMFNNIAPGSVTGDGRAMAYRVGAELVNMEMCGGHAGPKYFARAGQGTWVGVVRDRQGRPIGPFLTKPDKKYNDMIIAVYRGIFDDYAQSGRGPLYMDCRGISDEDFHYMIYWLKQEGNIALLDHLEEEGIDIRKHPIEFMNYGAMPLGLILINGQSETSLKGLYAAGDESLIGISYAATFGWIAGENGAARAKEQDIRETDSVMAKIEERKRLLKEIQSRKVGPDWKEVNIAIQQVMKDYAGRVRSETLLEAGFCHLRRIRDKAYTTMIARNQHELSRGLEVLNLLDLGEVVFITARERKETRAPHFRSDYPYTNPLMGKSLVVKKVDERAVIEWK